MCLHIKTHQKGGFRLVNKGAKNAKKGLKTRRITNT